jgi:uncharacterized protein with HEPN domain
VPSRHDIADSLWDILDNIERIESYRLGLDRKMLEANGQARDAIERCLERICEAAFRLGDRAGALLPEQPWPDIRGLGNWLRHAYDRVSFDVIWDTVENDLPRLKADVQVALGRNPTT